MRRAFFTARCDGEVSEVNFNLYDRKPFDTQAVAEMQIVLGCDHDKAILQFYCALRCLNTALSNEKFAHKMALLPGVLLVLNSHRLLYGISQFNRHQKMCGVTLSHEDKAYKTYSLS